jgi:hypothetical protein
VVRGPQSAFETQPFFAVFLFFLFFRYSAFVVKIKDTHKKVTV